jgi:hypothetical protein
MLRWLWMERFMFMGRRGYAGQGEGHSQDWLWHTRMKKGARRGPCPWGRFG